MRGTIGMPVSFLKGLDPDGTDINGDTPLDWLKWAIVTDQKPRSLFWPSLGEVVHFVELILELRELSWEAGLFLESKEKLEKDGSHARVKAWARHQQRLFMLDEDNRSIICNEHNVDLLWDNYPSEGEEEEENEEEDDEDEDEDEFFDAVENRIISLTNLVWLADISLILSTTFLHPPPPWPLSRRAFSHIYPSGELFQNAGYFILETNLTRCDVLDIN